MEGARELRGGLLHKGINQFMGVGDSQDLRVS